MVDYYPQNASTADNSNRFARLRPYLTRLASSVSGVAVFLQTSEPVNAEELDIHVDTTPPA